MRRLREQVPGPEGAAASSAASVAKRSHRDPLVNLPRDVRRVELHRAVYALALLVEELTMRDRKEVVESMADSDRLQEALSFLGFITQELERSGIKLP